MFTKIDILHIDLDRAFAAGLGYSLSYYFFFSFIEGVTFNVSTALYRGLEFFIVQCLSDVVIRNLDHASTNFVRKIKDQMSVDILAAVLMSAWTSYAITGSFLSFGTYPTTIGLSAVADLIGCYIAKGLNLPYIVGNEEAIRFENNQRRKTLEAIESPVMSSSIELEGDSYPNRGVGEIKIQYA